MTPEKLTALAIEAMGKAYYPYSGYAVGAALLCADGTVYQGCNIENASFTPTICAERTAFFKAIYDGHRSFTAIAICGGKGGKITVYINGQLLNECTTTTTEGYIALQSEGGPIEFRNLWLE